MQPHKIFCSLDIKEVPSVLPIVHEINSYFNYQYEDASFYSVKPHWISKQIVQNSCLCQNVSRRRFCILCLMRC